MAIKKNTNDLISQAATTLADNSTQDISPQDVREMAENNAFSSYNKITDNNLVGLKNYSTAATYEAAQGVVYNGSIYISNTIPTPGAFNASEWDILSGGEINTSSNSGAGEGLALAKSGSNLPFKSITAGTGITLTSAANELQISSAGGTDTNIGNANLTLDANRVLNLDNNNLKIEGGQIGISGAVNVDLALNITGTTNDATKGTLRCNDLAGNKMFSVDNAGNIEAPTTGLMNLGGAVIVGSTGLFKLAVKSNLPLVLRDANDSKLVSFANDGNRYTTNTTFGADSAPTARVDIRGSDNSAATSSLKVADINNNSLLDVKNNGKVDFNTVDTFLINNGTRSVGVPNWNTHTTWSLNNGSNSWDLICANAPSSVFNQNEFGLSYNNSGVIPFRIFGGDKIALGNVSKSNLDTNYSVNVKDGLSLLSGNLKINTGGLLDIQTKTGQTIKTGASTYPTLFFNNGSINRFIGHADSSSSTFASGDFVIARQGTSAPHILINSSNKILIGGALAPVGSENILLSGDTLLNGGVKMGNLPSLPAGTVSGDVWSQNGTLRIGNPTANIQTEVSAATITPNIDTTKLIVTSALAAALTIAAPTGTPQEGQELTFRFKDDGTARALTWNAIFEDYTGSLPTTTTAGKTVYIGCKYNLINTKWDVVAVQTQP